MTTYELPPEPPIGESVQDVHGRTWKHEGVNRWKKDGDYAAGSRSWSLLMQFAPLTLIESDSWPTESEPLIVADWAANKAKGHGLLYLDGHEYIAIESGRVLREGRDTLTNVVPVTVVPVAGVEALRASIKALGYGPESTRSAGSLLDTAIRLLEATDALGVSEG